MGMEQLKLLFDYTKFHIGLYATLVTGTIAVATFTKTGQAFGTLLKLMVGCFLLAGLAGGVVASHIPHVSNFETFTETNIGFWDINIMKPGAWERLEHLAFWVGIAVAFVGFLRTSLGAANG
jgi:hypothetical protein